MRGDSFDLFRSKGLDEVDPKIGGLLQRELERQRGTIELIASESFTWPAVFEAEGSVAGNKYASGFPGHRHYPGCELADEIELEAIERAKQLFGAEHANVQPYSGTSANEAVYLACLAPGETILSLPFEQGGHPTHGYDINLSGRLYNTVSYGLDRASSLIDYEQVRSLALEHRPRLIVCGGSAYPRAVDVERFREIADEAGALLMCDMAHFAGLVAAGLYKNPVPLCDFVTSTTHKTLAGPRGGFVLCKSRYAGALDDAVFPVLQGGPLVQLLAAKATCFEIAASEAFASFQRRVRANADRLAAELMAAGLEIVTGGSDTHMLLVDLGSTPWSGPEAERRLHAAGVTANEIAVPFDPRLPEASSGLRLGTPAVTMRGFDEEDMSEVAQIIVQALAEGADIEALAARSASLCERRPLYPGFGGYCRYSPESPAPDISTSPIPSKLRSALKRAQPERSISMAAAESLDLYRSAGLSEVDPDIGELLERELGRQRGTIELIASENFTWPGVLEALGSTPTNKYAEGLPGKRYYGGCEVVDEIEQLAIDRAKALFGAEHANVQAHAGAMANTAVYLGAPADRRHHPLALAGARRPPLARAQGQHLRAPLQHRLLRGQPRRLPDRLRRGAGAGARAQAQADHLRRIGLPARRRGRQVPRDRRRGGRAPDVRHGPLRRAGRRGPAPEPGAHCDFVTSTTHKTLAGPRAGFILCKAEHAQTVDRGIFPGLQGGPLLHTIAAKATCFKIAGSEPFKAYQRQVRANADRLASELIEGGLDIITGGTDTHLLYVDLRSTEWTGQAAEDRLHEVSVTVNKNAIPFDERPPTVTSGLRLGSPAVTMRGFDEEDMSEVAQIISGALAGDADLEALAARSAALCEKRPLYAGFRGYCGY